MKVTEVVINYLAVKPTRQRKGYGRKIMQPVEARLVKKGCPKISLQVRATDETITAFYEATGYDYDHVIALGKRFKHDSEQSVNTSTH